MFGAGAFGAPVVRTPLGWQSPCRGGRRLAVVYDIEDKPVDELCISKMIYC